MAETRPPQVMTAAKDLVPLAKAIIGILHRMRGQGYAPLPTEASAFFLYAAMAGVSHLLAHDVEPRLPSHMREAAYQLAPEIARLLREEVQLPQPPIGN